MMRYKKKEKVMNNIFKEAKKNKLVQIKNLTKKKINNHFIIMLKEYH